MVIEFNLIASRRAQKGGLREPGHVYAAHMYTSELSDVCLSHPSPLVGASAQFEAPRFEVAPSLLERSNF